MHIAEGVLSAPVLLAGWALTAGATALGLRRLDWEHVMSVSILAAAFFVASLIHVPVGPVSMHLVLNGLLGLVLGWAAFPAILCGLLLQAVFFQYGGFTSLGVNALNMALPALLCGYLLRPLLLKGGKARSVAAFAAGFLSVLLAGVFTSLSLALSDAGFLATAKVILLGHVPVMFVEGAITLFAVGFLARVQPELLGRASAPAHTPTPQEP